MKQHDLKIILNGVTGRMGTNQHLVRSLLAIREQGGVKGPNGDIIMPEPVLLGRNEEKLKALANEHNVKEWSTDIDACLARDDCQIYFDAQTTVLRVPSLRKAMAAGKDIYCEKPVAEHLEEALTLGPDAKAAGIKNGVVQDKLWLPGLIKLQKLIDEGFFGKILSVRGEFGYWVFDGEKVSCQRPSWNYRKNEGGSIAIDMLCHWRYVIDNLFGNVKSVSCTTATHIGKRWDEAGKPYDCTADDAAYATFLLDNGIICSFNSSWVTRVRRDDLLAIHVDGTEGSAVTGLTKCYMQPGGDTPKYVWNPDQANKVSYFDAWNEYMPDARFENAFKAQWELFLRHVIWDEPFRWTLDEGVKGIELAVKALESNRTRSWQDLEPIAG